MKLGLRDHQKNVTAAILLVVVVLLASHSLFQWQRSKLPITLTSGPLQLADPAAPHRKKAKDDASPDPTLDYRGLELVEQRVYKGNGRNIFRSQVMTPPTSIVIRPEPSPPCPATKIVVTSIALRFLGFAAMADKPKKAFLGEGDAIFVANEGDIVDRRYRVLRIDSNFVVVEDLIEESVHHLMLPTSASTG